MKTDSRFISALLAAVAVSSTGCAAGAPTEAVLRSARQLDASEPPPRLQPPADGRRWADRNGDGALDPDEWLAWEWRGVLRREDLDHNSLISEAEWLASKCSFGSPHSEVCARYNARQFHDLDRNRDGELSRAEFAVVSMGWFRQNDRNRDCRITPPQGEARGPAGPLWPCRPHPSR